jgi:phage-related protein
MVVFVGTSGKEIEALPEEVRTEVVEAVSRLDAGEFLSMPLSRPMPEIGRGVHELRVNSITGIYRVLYVLKPGVVGVLHAFKKTTKATPNRTIRLTRKRLKEVLS